MSRVCTICSHDERREIDRALIERTSYRAVACQYGVGRESLRRHSAEHLPELLTKAYEAEEAARADELLTSIKRLQVKTLLMLHHAEQAGELRTALAAVREARNNIAVLAEMEGKLDRRPQLNLTISPEWIELRTAIVVALEPHPEARAAVLKTIEENGDGRG